MAFIEGLKSFLGFDDKPDSDQNFDDNFDEPDPKSTNYSKTREHTKDSSHNTDRQFTMNATASLQVVLVRPEVFADTRQIADHLNQKKTVVLNLEATSPEVTRRIIDFIGGVAYANNGNIKPVANNTFIIFPYNVNFVGEDLAAELENNGVLL